MACVVSLWSRTIGVFNSLKQVSISVTMDAAFVRPHDLLFAISESGTMTGARLLLQSADLYATDLMSATYNVVNGSYLSVWQSSLGFSRNASIDRHISC